MNRYKSTPARLSNQLIETKIRYSEVIEMKKVQIVIVADIDQDISNARKDFGVSNYGIIKEITDDFNSAIIKSSLIDDFEVSYVKEVE